MAASKKSVIETLAKVKNLGPSYAEMAYEELGVQSLDDLIAAAKDGKLQTIKGVGANKEKAILESALELKGAAKKAAELVAPKTVPKAKPAPKAKAEKAAPAPKAPKAPKAKTAEKAAPAPKAPKAPAKPKAKAEPAKKPAAAKVETPKPEAKKEAPKSEAPKAAPKSEAPKAERPREKSSYTPPAKKSTNPVVFLGKLVFKIARKLLS